MIKNNNKERARDSGAADGARAGPGEAQACGFRGSGGPPEARALCCLNDLFIYVLFDFSCILFFSVCLYILFLILLVCVKHICFLNYIIMLLIYFLTEARAFFWPRLPRGASGYLLNY